MDTEIIFFYCVADDFFKSMHLKEDSQVHMNNAEVATVALTAACFFCGNLESSRKFLLENDYIPNMLSKSRLCRRLHSIPEEFWQYLPLSLPGIKEEMNKNKEFIIDSFPVPSCDNIRIARRHLYKEECYRGKCVSKRRYFLGLKAHLLMTIDYQPVEWILTVGSENDNKAFGRFNLNLPEGSIIYADSVNINYEVEDLLADAENIKLYSQRKSNSKRQRPGWTEYIIKMMRKKVETGFSVLTHLFPKKIHATTDEGFALKCAFFITAFSCLQSLF
jgi:DDE family transposase